MKFDESENTHYLFTPDSFHVTNEYKNDKDSLVGLLDNPSMPVMWDSEDEGEVWSWGKYVMVLQRKPKILVQVLPMLFDLVLNKEDIESCIKRLRYLYCLAAFYKDDTSTDCISSRPAFVLTIEQVNYAFLRDEPDLKDILDGCDACKIKVLKLLKK